MDETSVDLQTLEKEELDQKTNHRSLVKAKTRETLAVEVEKMKSELFEAERAPFVKVKGLITRLINRLQTEISHVSYCDEETSMAAEKEEADPESANEGHPDKICDQISDVVLDACLTCDTRCKVACETCMKDNMFMVAGGITVVGEFVHETVVRGVAQIIGIDSFIDDSSRVDNKGLHYQDCEVLFHVNKQEADIAEGLHVDRDDLHTGNGDLWWSCSDGETQVTDVPVVTRTAAAAYSSTTTTNKSNRQNRQ